MNNARVAVPQPPVPADEARRLRDAQRGVHAKQLRNEKLQHITARILADDAETLRQVGESVSREPSYLIRVAVHMFCEAARRNPEAVR
jgi:hypothetical protein